jgi:TatD DNase family protein
MPGTHLPLLKQLGRDGRRCDALLRRPPEHARASLTWASSSPAGNITLSQGAEHFAMLPAPGSAGQDVRTDDSPYLAPVPHRGKRNEPSFVTAVARQVGQLHGISPEEIGEQTSRNFRQFFRIL